MNNLELKDRYAATLSRGLVQLQLNFSFSPKRYVLDMELVKQQLLN